MRRKMHCGAGTLARRAGNRAGAWAASVNTPSAGMIAGAAGESARATKMQAALPRQLALDESVAGEARRPVMPQAVALRFERFGACGVARPPIQCPNLRVQVGHIDRVLQNRLR